MRLSGCEKCCWHPYTGPIMMVIPDGHVLQKCCKCENTRTIHLGHIAKAEA